MAKAATIEQCRARIEADCPAAHAGFIEDAARMLLQLERDAEKQRSPMGFVREASGLIHFHEDRRAA